MIRLQHQAKAALQSLFRQEADTFHRLTQRPVVDRRLLHQTSRPIRELFRPIYFAKQHTFMSDRSDIVALINEVVSRHDILLTQSAVHNTVAEIIFFEPIDALSCPFLDLRQQSIEEIDLFIHEVLRYYYQTNNAFKTMPFRHVLLHVSDHTYRYLYLLDELIHDEYTEDLITTSINQALSGLDPCNPKQNYVNYLISRDQRQFKEDVLCDIFCLKEFMALCCRNQMLIHCPSIYNRPFSFDIPALYRDLHPWTISLAILVAACKTCFDLSSIPLFIDHDCRCLDPDYYAIAGDFEDYLPFILHLDQSIFQLEQRLVSLMAQHRKHPVYFSDLLIYGNYTQAEGAPNMVQAFKAFNETIPSLCSPVFFRYQGHYATEKSIELIDSDFYQKEGLAPYMPRWGASSVVNIFGSGQTWNIEIRSSNPLNQDTFMLRLVALLDDYLQ